MFLARSRQMSASGRDSSTCYYDPKSYTLNVDGQLAIRAHGGEEGETRWRGFMLLLPWEPDYDFWYWMTRIRQVSELVRENELKRWKRHYADSRQNLVQAIR
jgi:hypothetical protein